MSTSRREFLGSTIVLGGAALTFTSFGCTATPPRSAPKRILILGGTGFIGPKTVEAALARGHRVTVFNRGHREKYRPLAFKDVEHLYGNRDPELPADDERGEDKQLLHPDAKPKGLEQLVGKQWDAVIDNSGYYPRMVAASAKLLAAGAKQYIYISSISAYASQKVPGADETAELAKLADPNVEDMGKGYENYGGLKALCEKAAEIAFPGHAAIVRPGYIVGPGDFSDRFTYWPVRIAKGGEALIPGSPEDPLQWIDVRDLGEWLVKLVEDGRISLDDPVDEWLPELLAPG
jgi:2'-hydroxyisoflavone reductase